MIALILARIAASVRRARYVLRDDDDRAPLPGPGAAQASRWPDEDTGIRGWSDAEMAYLKGETDVMPNG